VHSDRAVDAFRGVEYPRSDVLTVGSPPPHTDAIGSERDFGDSEVPLPAWAPAHRYPRAPPPRGKNRKFHLVAAAGLGLAGMGTFLVEGVSSHNSTKRTSEAFEGRANAELVERALGDDDLDK